MDGGWPGDESCKAFIHTFCDGELLYKLGFTPENIVSKGLREILPPDFADEHAVYYQKAWEGEETVYEVEVNGFRLLTALRPIRRGGRVFEVVGSCVDSSNVIKIMKKTDGMEVSRT